MKTPLKKEEKVILEINPHWFCLVVPAIVTLIAIVIGFSIGGLGILIGIIFIAFFVYKIFERNNNSWTVTTLRVIDECGVFSKSSKESPLEKINNVSYSQSLWGRLFGYGNVQIQTAAEIGVTTYYNVENPKKLKDTITRMQEEYKNYQIKKQAMELANAIIGDKKSNNPIADVPHEIEKLYELKQKGMITEEEYNNRKTKILNL
jgi:uncharacterized membrane protein YdbT with pleckstrin-like domain